MVNVMRSPAIRLLFILLCTLLPTYASAAISQTIQAEWNSYTPPEGRTVTAFKLYQEGISVCQTTIQAATAMDCTVTLTSDTTSFTLTAVLDDGTESPHSSPTPFTLTTSSNPQESLDNSIDTGTTSPDPTIPETTFPDTSDSDTVAADITTNKNMVPFDSRSPFQTSGLRFGTPAITTRGLKEDKMELIVELIDRVLHDPENEANIAAVRKEVNALMSQYPLFAW